MEVTRCNYIIATNMPKRNGQNLTAQDYLQIGYMAGRFGINLDGNVNANYPMQNTPHGTVVNINSCTRDLFEKSLNDAGINFSILA